VLRLGRPSDIWFKPALSAVVAVVPPNLILLALGRLDLAMYTMAGSLCALYGHNLPYARRVRAVAGVVLAMVLGMAVSLVTASLTGSPTVLIAVGALLAAAQKTLCDATRIGPPGPVIFTFVTSAATDDEGRALLTHLGFPFQTKEIAVANKAAVKKKRGPVPTGKKKKR